MPYDIDTELYYRECLKKMFNYYFDDYKETSEYKKISNSTGEVYATLNSFVATGLEQDIIPTLTALSHFANTNFITKDSFEKAKAELIDKYEAKPQLKNKSKFSQNTIKDSLAFKVDTSKVVEHYSIEDLNSMTYSKAKAWYKKYINANNANMTVSGNFSEKDVQRINSRYFSKLGKGEKLTLRKSHEYKINEPQQTKIFVIDKPNSTQTTISVTWSLGDAYPYGENQPTLLVLNQIFGEGYNSNLNRNIRLEKGLCYGIKNMMSINYTGGESNTFVNVRTEKTYLALENILFEMSKMRNQPVTEQEIEYAKNKILGEFAISMSAINSPAIIGFGMQKEEYNLPDDYLTTYPSRFDNITPSQIMEYARKYIKPYNAIIYLSGDVNELRMQGLENIAEVVYYSEDGKKLF